MRCVMRSLDGTRVKLNSHAVIVTLYDLASAFLHGANGIVQPWLILVQPQLICPLVTNHHIRHDQKNIDDDITYKYTAIYRKCQAKGLQALSWEFFTDGSRLRYAVRATSHSELAAKSTSRVVQLRAVVIRGRHGCSVGRRRARRRAF